jgi:DNA polymerase III delta prime subunit
MSDLVKKLYWSRYRPKNIDGMILLPRIKRELINDNNEVVLNGNYLFCGTSGIGKTSLAKVIIPENALVVNASFNSSVEDLKEEVIDYCRTGDIFGSSSLDGYKIVFLDEFDGVSQKYQEALRGFIEEYEDRIRFIATCNNISKISPAMLSRFNVIKFDPENEKETKYLKNEYFERCLFIKEKNNLNISDEQIKSLINLNFPDLRSVFSTLQRVSKIGEWNTNLNISDNNTLYSILFDKINTENTYNYVIQTYGDNVENLIKLCGRPLCEYIMTHQTKHINKLPKLIKINATYSTQLQTCIDPLVLALSCVYEIQEILNI